MPNNIEEVGWRYIDISLDACKKVEDSLIALGVDISALNVADIVTEYHSFKSLQEYDSDYKSYGGTLDHCFIEKSLEHFLSIQLIKPRPGLIGIDIGSCQSVLPQIGRRVYKIQYYEQDLTYPAGIDGNRIGSSADAIPLPDESVDFMTLHCTFEHFEKNADTGFVKECARLLKKGGRTVILPLYLNERFCNITGETDPKVQNQISFDADADHYCLIPEWQNRFGRHYSPDAFVNRVWEPALRYGLHPHLYRIENWATIHADLWLRWILFIDR
jgi:SAM-dependent methyltransferase